MKNFSILLALLVPMISNAVPGWTQTKQRNPAFEFGLGGSAMNYTRTYVSDFSVKPDGSYVFDLKSKQLYGGVNTYMAYGLLEWMYLDLQGTLGMARYDERGVEKRGLSLMFGPAFNSGLSATVNGSSPLRAWGSTISPKISRPRISDFLNTIPPDRRIGKRKMLGTKGRPRMSTKPSPFHSGVV